MEASEEQIASAIARLDGDEWMGYINLDRVAIQMVAIGPKAIPHLARALKSDTPNVRAGAACALGGIPSEQTIGLLLAALNDPETLVRRHAVNGLSEVGSQEAVSLLTQVWETEQDKDVRSAIVRAFENLRTMETENILLNAMNEGDFGSAWPAATILADWKHPQAALGMLEIAMQATDEEWDSYDFYGKAIYVLGKGDSSVIPAYLDALENNSESARCAVVAALGYVGDPAVVPALIRLLDDPDKSVRFESILSLGRIGMPEALSALLPLLRNDTTETEYALEAVHRAMDPEIIAACANCLLHPSRRISNRAAEALATQGADGMAALIAALASPVATIRIAATEGLWHTKDPAATEPLIRALNDENERVRRIAAVALRSIADPRSADALLALMNDPGVRRSAARALGKMRDRRAAPKICALLTGKDTRKHRSAMRDLWNLADPDSYDTLLIACANEDDYVRQQAAMALGWLNLPAAADHLVSMLHHEQSFEVRSGAAYALGALGLEWTRGELIRAWWEDDMSVFYAAHAALERFGDRDLCLPEK